MMGGIDMQRLTATIIKKYQERKEEITTIGEYKALGRELRDQFGLSDRDAIDLLNNNSIVDIMSRYEANY